jgi:hypothetical protein
MSVRQAAHSGRKISQSPIVNAIQGYAFDGTYNYLFSSNQIDKRNNDNTWSLVTSNANPLGGITGTDHQGDGDVYNGLIYSPVEHYNGCSDVSHQNILVSQSSDLSQVAVHDVSAQGKEIAGIAVVPSLGANGIIFAASFCDPNTILKYDLSTFAYLGSIVLQSTIPYAQGIAYQNGLLYVSGSADNLHGVLYQVDPITGSVQSVYATSLVGEPEGIDGHTPNIGWLINPGSNDTVHFIGLQTSASTAFIVTSSGNIGTGTTSPSSKLSIKAGGTTTGRAFVISDSGDAEKFTVLDNGNVGLGVSSPVSRLQVVADYGGAGNDDLGQLLVTGATNPARRLQLAYDTSGNYGVIRAVESGIAEKNLILNPSNGSAKVGIASTSPWAKFSVNPNALGSGVPEFAIGSSTSTHFVVTGGGNVGIGTSNPSSSQLHIVTNTTGQFGATIRLQTLGGTTNGDFFMAATDNSWGIGGNKLIFGAGVPASNNVKMTMDSAGNIGIGTAAPVAKLMVIGESTITYPAIGSSTGAIHIGPSVGTNDDTMALTFGGMVNGLTQQGSGTAGIYVQSSGGYGSKMYFGTASNFSAGSQARMMIDNVGRIGIGTTSPVARLSIAGFGNSTGLAFAISDVSSTTRFVIQDNGNVGIGTVTPTSPLHIFGTPAGGSNDQLALIQSSISAGTSAYVAEDNTGTRFLTFGVNNGAGGGGSYGAASEGIVRASTSAVGLSLSAVNGYIRFLGTVNGTELVRISTNGLMGLGSTTPWAQLSVNPNGVTGPEFVVGSSTATHLIVTNSGNVGIGTTTPTLGPLTMNSGAYVTTGGVWTNASDRNLKENFTELDSADILKKIAALPITQWNYKTESASTTHIGPVAQDFYAAFHTGNSDTSISTIDPAGVALLGIKALYSTVSDMSKYFVSGVLHIAEIVTDKITAKHVYTDEICVGTACVNQDQFLAMARAAGVTPTQPDGSTASSGSSSSGPSADTTSPIITILGQNPSQISAGTAYSDMGASVTDTDASGTVNTNLGLHYSVDGASVTSVSLDTSTTTTHTIVYSAVDSAGNWGFATRTVEVLPQ